jgi:hypothetical protein
MAEMKGHWRKPWTIRSGAAASILLLSALLLSALLAGTWTQPISPSARLPLETPAPAALQHAVSPPQDTVIRSAMAEDVQACNDAARIAAQGKKMWQLPTKGEAGAASRADVGVIPEGGNRPAIGGVAGARVGALYRLDESSQMNPKATEAYRVCMRSRGHAG